MSSHDKSILEIAGDLCKQLNLSKLTPGTLVWADYVGGARTKRVRVLPDQPMFGRFGRRRPLILASSVKNKFSLEEWKTLLSTALVWSMGPSLFLSPLTVLVAVVLPLVAILVASSLLSFTGASLSVMASGLIVYLILFTQIEARRVARRRWKSHLRADLEAVRLFGKSPLLDLLRKIDFMGLPEIDRQKRERLRKFTTSDRPSITERIENLQTGNIENASP